MVSDSVAEGRSEISAPAPDSLKQLVGRWRGTSRLWRPWLSPPDSESESTASVAPTARGKFVTIGYTWAVDGEPQEGLLLLRHDDKRNTVKAVWLDSWHMSNDFMMCEGSIDSTGVVSILGSYAAPPGPDWGWRTIIEPGHAASFEILMYNITPDGVETLAFKNRYER